MTAEALLPYSVAIVGALLGLLCTILAWVGAQIKKELNDLGLEMRHTNGTLSRIERDLRGELAGLDRRVAVVEAQCRTTHGHND